VKTIRLCAFFASFVLSCFAQEPTATLFGRITDATGGVAPNVAVEVGNVDTGVKWQAQTNGAGYYTVPLLPPGNYQITAKLDGFRPVTRAITLAVDQVARVSFALEVGAVTETIIVTSAPPVLENGTASMGQVVTARAVRDLPLNGRNYLDLAKMALGVAEPSGAGTPGTTGDRAKNGGGFVANGVRSDMNNFILDGVDNNAKIPDLSSNSNVIIQPSVDAIQEFKVETNNFSAEYGYSAGAVVNATIKNGTNAFHGTAFEFLRNDQLDARDYFLQPTAKKAILQRNLYGGTVGGPAIKNKTFFFGSWEGTRLNQGTTLVTVIPTDAMKGGNFSGAGLKPIFDPSSLAPNPAGAGFIRSQFPGNIIPASQLDPRSTKLSTLIPEPNNPGANNFAVAPEQRNKRNQFDVRGDQNFSDKDKLFLRYSYYTLNYVAPGPFGPPLIGSTAFQTSSNDQSGHEAAIGESHLFSANLVNEFRAGYNRISNALAPFVKDNITQQFGFVGVPQQPGVTGLPNIVISGFSNLGEAAFLPDAKGSDTAMVSDNLLWTHGNHFFKFGGTFRWVRSRFDIAGNARGTFNFDGSFSQNPQSRGNSGNAYADFLLGDASGGTLTNIFIGDLRYKYYGGFVNDDWKVSPKLTLNLGVRYEIWTPPYERHDQMANFVIGPNKLIYPNDKTPSLIPSSLTETIPSGVDSRALTEFHKNNWAPRLGLAYQLGNSTVIRTGAGVFYAEPDALGASGRPVANPPFRVTTTYPTDQIHTNLTFQNGYPANALNFQAVDPSNTTFIAFAPDLKPAYYYHWSFGVQQQVSQYLIDANYVGTKGTHLSTNYDYNTPYAGGTSVAARRPVPGFGSLTYVSSMGNSEYNALQVRVERRYSSGLAMLVAYTYSKSIDLSGGGLVADIHLREVNNVGLERALSSSDMRNRFVVAYMYDLPFGHGQRFNITNRALNAVAGDWQVNGITTVHSGQPITPQTANSSANTGDPRPNRIGDGNLPSDQRSVSNWFDKTAFALAPAYNFGNAGRDIITSPGAVNFDFSALKKFPVKKLGEAGLIQIRAEFFNILNHPQFGQPSPRVDIPSGASITYLTTPMRTIQFGVKVIF
jgi:hypothetical protein